MSRHSTILHQFVEYIPSDLIEGTLYISIAYATAVHKCCCGCGDKVVTPLSPTDWKLIFDGETVSLDPSIGNWSFRCRSHYWIRRNRIKWAQTWNDKQIQTNRARDKMAKDLYFGGIGAPDSKGAGSQTRNPIECKTRNRKGPTTNSS
jgi:uncharacterized protein DUF6527